MDLKITPMQQLQQIEQAAKTNESDGTELETVSGEGEWRSTVAVGVIDHQLRNLRDIQLHTLTDYEHVKGWQICFRELYLPAYLPDIYHSSIILSVV